MAELIEGLQGSGKSYYASYKMFYDSSKYHKIFTNIDGIKTTDKIFGLEFKKFINEILVDCYNSQVAMDGSFDESIKILQKFSILPKDVNENNRVLIVVDEAQNYFGKSVKLEASLVWFITQHRHLYIELYLITQKYTLLRSDYHLFNLVYKAYPPVKQFSSKKIRYAQYAGLPLNDDNFVKKFTLPKEQKVFDMYISGDKVESPSILKRFFYFFIFLILFIISVLYYFFSSFGSSPTPTFEKVETMLNVPAVPIEKKKNHQDKKLFEIVVWNDGYFYIRGINSEKEYPIKFLKYIKDEFFITVVENIKMSQYRSIIYVICNKEIIDFLSPSNINNASKMGLLVKDEIENI